MRRAPSWRHWRAGNSHRTPSRDGDHTDVGKHGGELSVVFVHNGLRQKVGYHRWKCRDYSVARSRPASKRHALWDVVAVEASEWSAESL